MTDPLEDFLSRHVSACLDVTAVTCPCGIKTDPDPLCKECAGTGRILPTDVDPYMLAMVTVATFAGDRLREGDFDTCHRTLEWGAAITDRYRASVSSETLESIDWDAYLRKFNESPPGSGTPLAGQLSDDELQELLGDEPGPESKD